MRFFSWFAGFFEDIKGTASSKRAIVFLASYLLAVIVFAAREGKWLNDAIHMQIFWGVVLIVLFGIGAISKESLSKVLESKFGVKEVETANSTVTTSDQIDTIKD